MSAGIALLDVAAQGCGATLLDGTHNAMLLPVERASMQTPVCRTMTVQDVRQFERRLHQGSRVLRWLFGSSLRGQPAAVGQRD